MLQTLFLTAVNLSIAATLVGVVVVGLRFFLRKVFSRRALCLLWTLVLIRLLFPVMPASPVSAFSVFGAPTADAPGDFGSALTFLEESGATVVYPAFVSHPQPELVAVPTPPEFILAHIWVWGAALLTLYTLAHYAWLMAKVRRSAPLDPRLIPIPLNPGRAKFYCLEELREPMVCGVLRPKVLLPPGFSRLPEEDQRMMLAHEFAHLRRKDSLAKLLWTLALYLHWFNPFLWLMRRAVERDTELSCDEAALAALPAEEHAAYGQTILNAVTQLKAP